MFRQLSSPLRWRLPLLRYPTGINLLTGELTGETSELAYSASAALVDNANNAGKLSFDYIFAPQAKDEQYLTDFTMSFYGASGATVAPDYAFTNIPAQRNYRTMVSGNLLTKGTKCQRLRVDPAFGGEIEGIVEVSKPEDLLNTIAQGGAVRLTGDMELDESFVVSGKSASIDLNGKTLTVGEIKMNANNGELLIENGTIVAEEMSDAVNTIFYAEQNGVVTLDGVTIKTNGSVAGPATSVNGDNSTVIIKNSTIECGAYALGNECYGSPLLRM